MSGNEDGSIFKEYYKPTKVPYHWLSAVPKQ